MNIRFSALDLQASCDLLIVGVAKGLDSDFDSLDHAFGGELKRLAEAREFTGAAGSSLALPTMGRIGARDLLLLGVGDGDEDAVWAAACKAGKAARAAKATSVQLALEGLTADRQILGFGSGNYAYLAYKPESERSASVDELTIVGDEDETDDALILAKYTDWARDLINQPPADLYPETLAAAAYTLASIPNVTVTVWDEKKLAEEGCVGLIGVGQGSTRPPRMIHVRYAPADSKAHVALVGKGITFDSGGLSLKPSASMMTMKCDMGGAGTVLGAVGAIAALGAPVTVDCFVASAENMLGANSYKLSDVLKYNNGVTVEVHNTDAEGRLVLADALLLASAVEGATHIIDVATLTGACAIATGPAFAGLFTPSDELAGELLEHAQANGDGLWRMPYYLPYKASLKSDVAQIKNVGAREGGATSAALFLGHFVAENKVWAHIDIAGNAFMEKSTEHYAAGATGELVRTLVAWAQAQADADAE